METLKFALYIKHDTHEFKEAAKIHYAEACEKLACRSWRHALQYITKQSTINM